jgi:hypothetical protein
MVLKKLAAILAALALCSVLTWLVYPSGLADVLYFGGGLIFFFLLISFLGRRDRWHS